MPVITLKAVKDPAHCAAKMDSSGIRDRLCWTCPVLLTSSQPTFCSCNCCYNQPKTYISHSIILAGSNLTYLLNMCVFLLVKSSNTMSWEKIKPHLHHHFIKHFSPFSNSVQSSSDEHTVNQILKHQKAVSTKIFVTDDYHRENLKFLCQFLPSLSCTLFLTFPNANCYAKCFRKKNLKYVSHTFRILNLFEETYLIPITITNHVTTNYKTIGVLTVKRCREIKKVHWPKMSNEITKIRTNKWRQQVDEIGGGSIRGNSFEGMES